MTRIKGLPAGPATRAAPPAPGRLGRIGAWCYDHRHSVLLGWVTGVIAIIALASAAGSALRTTSAASASRDRPSGIAVERDLGAAFGLVVRSMGAITTMGAGLKAMRQAR